MLNLRDKEYLIIVQCDIVKQRCSGYDCERTYHTRTGGFAGYPKDKNYRVMFMTCGGCCGRALQRKLAHLARKAKKVEDIERNKFVVQLSSCITLDNHHGPPCPHLDYLKVLMNRANFDFQEDTSIASVSEKKRQEGVYSAKKR